MKLLIKTVAFGAIAAALTACSSVDTVTRNAPLEASRVGAAVQQQAARNYALHSIRFSVPTDMSISEANGYYPIADIVWRGDPIGNRAQQISDIFHTSIRAAGESMTGSRPVTIDVELVRFHSLSDRARFSVGGVHNIVFNLTIRDAATGEIVESTRRVSADLAALGGRAALAADYQGQTQKVRVLAHLTSAFQRELTSNMQGAGFVSTGG